MHYMRLRRHGDASVADRPGPKPSKPEPRVEDIEGVEVEALRRQLAQADAEIRDLKRRLASAQEPLAADRQSATVEDAEDEVRAALARLLAAKLPRATDEQIERMSDIILMDLDFLEEILADVLEDEGRES